jgi:hypothetical protein
MQQLLFVVVDSFATVPMLQNHNNLLFFLLLYVQEAGKKSASNVNLLLSGTGPEEWTTSLTCVPVRTIYR